MRRSGKNTRRVQKHNMHKISKNRTFIQVNKEQNILLIGWTREMPSGPVRIPNTLLQIRSKTPCDSWAMLVSPPIMAKSRQKETRLQKSQRKILLCSASLMDSNISIFLLVLLHRVLLLNKGYYTNLIYFYWFCYTACPCCTRDITPI